MHESLRALDWDQVLESLSTFARTRRGASACRDAPLLALPAQVREAYAEVEEVLEAWRRGDDVPVGGVGDVDSAVDRAGRGVVLEPWELREVGGSARALEALRDWSEARADAFPRLMRLAAGIQVDPELLEILGYAFDAEGQLDARTWPELGLLRRRIDQLKDRIRATLDQILKGVEWEGALQDRFVTEREGRFVVPVKMAARRGLGIVHGVSGSGETAFVEPTAVVELHNELKETEGELLRTERRILTELSREVGRRAGPLRAALVAAVHVDLAVARAGLGRHWDGAVPTVGNEGVVALKRARHPLLALRARGVGREDVVGNDLALSPARPGLVLTGPNAGGKTVALKTIGLCALLVRAGVPLPVDAPSRCDVFARVVADVGDQQSVAGGLSTFSAHVGLLREALAAAAPGALVLLDEVAVGTDPAQGAALARAVLEAVVDAGARVVATTHYPELKAMGGADGRFVVAAAQYEDGKPTYRLVTGLPGASYALAMARALGLDGAVIDRARTLLDEGQRQLADTLERLTAERAEVAAQARSMEARGAVLDARTREVEAAEARLAREGRKRMEEALALHREVLRKREDEVRALVAQLQAGGDLGAAGRALETIRAGRAALVPAATVVEEPAYDPQLGELVLVRSVGKPGRVVSLGELVEVEIGRMRMRVPRSGIAPARAKDRRVEDVGPRVEVAADAPRGRSERSSGSREVDVAYVRTPGNTIDLRGMRAEEAVEVAERFLDGMTLRPDRVAFVAHGHGTGALKRAVRAWLPTCAGVRRWRPANADEGGDGFTVVELHG
jgi:DNA mismatch repair protein MutS2